MLKRKAMKQLESWKAHKTHQALLVTGARQVGKTYLIRAFAQQNYESLVEINLIERPEAREAFETATSADALFLRISAFAEQELIPRKTLIFIDEVQECTEIVTALKFLVERYGGEYDLVVSGSLLGVELKDVRSMPVGYLSTVQMYPLDLEEFCWAQGIPQIVLDEVSESFNEAREVDATVHARMTQLFHDYLVVGGMPDAVQAYTESHDMKRVQRVRDDIIGLYRHDISKYAGSRARVARRIFDLIPAELNTQSKRFCFSHVEGTSRFDKYDNDFMWLADAGVALPTYNVTEPHYPLELSADSSYFKLFLCDVGLLAGMCGMDLVREMLSNRTDVNYGSIYENFAAQEIAAHGLASPGPDPHLYYFRNRKIGELDFLVEWPRGHVLPIEVKSGKSYKRHSALTAALGTENYGLDQAFVLYEGNVKVEGKVRYLPMYMTLCIKREG